LKNTITLKTRNCQVIFFIRNRCFSVCWK